MSWIKKFLKKNENFPKEINFLAVQGYWRTRYF